ncbi:MAG TPA: protein kinase [Polyangiaceae bacterium]|nr:protein kinase [Polyangiaceae bacterium]
MSDPLSTVNGTQLVPGCVVGNKYRIDGCLGEGGMGVVLSATHLELDAPVAIKIVREEYAGSEDIVERVLFEARAVARMRSNHVVRVLDVARLDSGCPYIVMEQLQGEDLGHALWERGPLSVPQAIDYLLQACDGLAEAHGLGIVHRDLKPGNLFLATTPEGVVLKVLDFGISKEIDSPLRSVARIPRTSLTSAGDPVGSPFYMAPEQMRASPDVDSRADIWSLGAILFELLTGQCPFEGETITEVCGKVMVEAPPSLSAYSSCAATELDSVIARCLEKDPNLRYQSVGELSHALRSWRPSEDVELPEPEPQWRLRRSARLPLAMVGLSALLVLGGVGLWQAHGNAASFGPPRAVQPVIAAAASALWRSLPEPPIVEPVASDAHAHSKSKRATYPSFFRTTPKDPAPVIRTMTRAEPAEIALDTSSDATTPAAETAPSQASSAQANEATTNEPPVNAVDPVSGRYGL